MHGIAVSDEGGVRGCSRRGRSARGGLHLRAALPRAAGAPGGTQGLERRRARRDRHARCDDRRSAGKGARTEQAMNSVHDMGGMHGMGPVEIEKNEPVFHSAWEARVHALNIACGYHRKWNIDVGRHSRERIPPAEYLAATYYEKWLRGLEMLLVENGLLTAKELETGRAESKAGGASALRPSEVAAYLRVRRLARLDDDVAPKFRSGDPVLTHNDHPVGHPRLPRYARGKRGFMHRDPVVFVLPCTHAMSRDKKPQHCYSVRFAARELWGAGASARDSVSVDLWDDDPAPA